jgi:hypothetical protein
LAQGNSEWRYRLQEPLLLNFRYGGFVSAPTTNGGRALRVTVLETWPGPASAVQCAELNYRVSVCGPRALPRGAFDLVTLSLQQEKYEMKMELIILTLAVKVSVYYGNVLL